MKVTFVKHSCFFIEEEDFCLLFDYYDGELPKDADRKKPLYVLESHFHGDHFSEKVFSAAADFEKVFYFLSFDISPKRIPEKICVQRMKPHEKAETEHFTVETLKSTDEGVAFLLSRGETSLYHAGDLNCWKWDGEPEDYNRMMEENYQKEMEFLKGKSMTAAFVPLDPRQEIYFDLGMLEYIEAVPDTKYLFPMHMWQDHRVIQKFQEKHGIELMNVLEEGQSFILKEAFK